MKSASPKLSNLLTAIKDLTLHYLRQPVYNQQDADVIETLWDLAEEKHESGADKLDDQHNECAHYGSHETAYKHIPNLTNAIP